MMRCSHFNRINVTLQRYKNNFEEPFGGIDLFISGDFSQLGPMAGPLYRRFYLQTIRNPKLSEGSINGNKLYHECIDMVTILTENRRCSPEYAALLDRFRTNEPTKEDIEKINKRLIGLDNVIPPVNAPFVFPRNVNREALNDFAFERLVEAENINIAEDDIDSIKFLTIIMDVKLPDIKEAKNNRTLEYLKACIRNQSEEKLCKMSGYLNVIIGGPAIVNQNHCVEKGIANGTSCVFAKVVLTKSAVIKRRQLPGTKLFVHCVYVSEVERLILKHTLKRFKEMSIDPALPLGCFAIPTTSAKVSIKWKGSMKCNITGYKVVPNWSFTGHKTQGKTMRDVIIGDIHGHKYNQTGWIYVLLSRVHDLDHVFLIKPLSTKMSLYRRRSEIMTEHDRLEQLAKQTAAKLQAAGYQVVL